LSKLPRTASEIEKQRLEREAKETTATPVVSVPGHDE